MILPTMRFGDAAPATFQRGAGAERAEPKAKGFREELAAEEEGEGIEEPAVEVQPPEVVLWIAPVPEEPEIEENKTSTVEPTSTSPSPSTSTSTSTSTIKPVLPTPLEQAIHDLLDQLLPVRAPKEEKPAPEIADEIPPPPPAVVPTKEAPREEPKTPAPVAARPIEAPPEPQGPPSHLRLVVGDEADRVVIAVRVRGEAVSVSMHTTDDATAAALARNAPVLADAMRTRGVALAELATSTAGDRERRPPPRRERREVEEEVPDFEL